MNEGKRKKVKAEPEVESDISREEIMKALGPRLAAARNGAKLTQSALAAKMKCVPAYVSMLELSQRLPSVEVLVAWAGACDVPVSDFFTGMEAEVEAGR